jgi:hypothetical protein
VGRSLLRSAIAIDPLGAQNGVVGNLTAVGAFGLLEGTVPTDDPEDRVQLAAILEEMASALPRLVEHAASHLEDDDEDELEDDRATTASFHDEPQDELRDELEEDLQDDEFTLDDALTALDARLRVTDEASEGADVAFHVACALLIQSLPAVLGLPATFEARVRVIAAGDALMSGEQEVNPFEVGEVAPLLETAYTRAAALLEADLPGPAPAAEPVEVQFSQLDEVVGAMQDLADHELLEELAGALALIGGLAQTLRAGVALGHQDADTQGRMAAALGALDPLALADLPEARAAGAQTLRELSRSVHESAAAATTSR